MSDIAAIFFIFASSFLGGMLGGMFGVCLAWRCARWSNRYMEHGTTGL